MKKFTTLLTLYLSVFFYSQTVQVYKDRADLVRQSNLTTYTSDLVATGIRYLGSNSAYTSNYTKNKAAQDYIYNKLISFGYSASDIQLQNIGTSIKPFYNIILSKTGTIYPNEYVIMGSHFDSVSAGVGANDNLSGVSTVLEAARILKTLSTEYSVKFIFFNAEENGTYNGVSGGTYGSKKYVENIALNGTISNTTDDMKIRLMFNIDMIGGVKEAGYYNNTITTEADRGKDEQNGGPINSVGNTTTNDVASTNFTNELKNYIEFCSTVKGVIEMAYGSDYKWFEYYGYPITGLYERTTSSATIDLNTPGNRKTNVYYHQSGDNYSRVDFDYLFQVAKGAVGAIQSFAVADQTTSVLPTKEVTDFNNLKIYPNPAKELINIEVPNTNNYEINLIDTNGKIILIDKNKKQINISKLKNGVYYLILKTKEQSIFEPILIVN